MTTRLQQSLKPGQAAVPDFRSLVEETDELIKKQRQKGAEYKFREGPGRPQVALEVDAGLSESTRAAGAASPAKGKPEEMAKTGASVGGLDDYDPNELAAKEQAALVETVSKMRGEASHLYADVGALTKKFDFLKGTLEQLAYEDDVDNERRLGLTRMRDLKARIQFLTLSLEDSEHYSRVLYHVIKRLGDEKLSKLATMKAFEDALKVQRHELELVQEVQRGAVKSRDEEQAELVRLQGEVKRQIAVLDKKLEARRMEVKVRQEKAKWRLAKLQEEMSLKAQAEGDLTEEEERAMIAKAQNLSQEAAELRAEKIKAQADADAAEAEYAKLRVAAGISSALDIDSPRITASEPVEGEDEGAGFIQPDPTPLIDRYNILEEEMRNIEDQLADYTNRVSVLQQQLGLLRGLAEPRAKDERDEEDRDVVILQALRERIAVAKRALEGMNRESEEARGLRMQLEQSVSVLMDRLDSLPPPFLGATSSGSGAGMSAEEAETEAMAYGALEEMGNAQPTAWAKSVHDRTVAATKALHALMRVMDPIAAAAALSKATQGLGRAMAGEEGQASPAGFGSSSSAAAGAAHGSSSSAAAMSGTTREEAPMSAGELDTDKRMDATIESLIVKNEWSIRVRPGSSGPNRPIKAISGRALAEAVQAFEKTWKDVSSGAAGAPANFAASDYLPTDRTNDAFSKEASRQRRRNSRIELETAYAAAAVAASGNSVPTVPDDSGDADAGGDPRGKKKADTGKPKTKDITRFLATAAAMAGDDVDESSVAVGQTSKKDADDVLTRDRLKRNVKVATAAQQQQAGQAGGAGQKAAAGKR